MPMKDFQKRLKNLPLERKRNDLNLLALYSRNSDNNFITRLYEIRHVFSRPLSLRGEVWIFWMARIERNLNEKDLIMNIELARQKAAQAWCKETTQHKEMDVELAEAFAEILEEYIEALHWCTGSADFGEGGQARKGWLKLCAPLLQLLHVQED